ncbi:beta-2 adrenergic receptor-like [Anneissia japonica]|uniref:beta-2 adrenergic receptor-like n=1 Tax=Anneissia japonica TaxID=1529436 RepID=UPI00142589D1|nr:beta-2 adrenergic receptor-like [Anneissia japonica]
MQEPTDNSGGYVNFSWTYLYSNTSIEDLWLKDSLATWVFVRNVLTTVFGSVAFLGNVLTVIVALAKKEIRKKFSNYQIINLAIKDAIIGGIMVYLSVIEMTGLWTKKNSINLGIIASMLLLTSSSLTIIMIAMERCFAIVAPFQHSRYVTKKRLTIIIVIDWFVTISLANIFPITNMEIDIWVVGQFVMLCAPVLTFIIYLVIILVVRRHDTKIRQSANRSERKKRKQHVEMIKTFTLVAGIFIICYIPYIIILEISLATFSLGLFKSLIILDTFIPLNSAANMFIYWWRIPEFRMAYMRALCCHRNMGSALKGV